jgi:succinate dehydrogenase/fumarate reductase-like Fe-S protein
MYAAEYGNLYQARDTLDSLEAGKSIKTCAECENCTAQCVRRVNIARRIDELKTLFT